MLFQGTALPGTWSSTHRKNVCDLNPGVGNILWWTKAPSPPMRCLRPRSCWETYPGGRNRLFGPLSTLFAQAVHRTEPTTRKKLGDFPCLYLPDSYIGFMDESLSDDRDERNACLLWSGQPQFPANGIDDGEHLHQHPEVVRREPAIPTTRYHRRFSFLVKRQLLLHHCCARRDISNTPL